MLTSEQGRRAVGEQEETGGCKAGQWEIIIMMRKMREGK